MAELSAEDALALLAEDALAPTRGGRGPRKDTTEPRVGEVWFTLLTGITEPCENPDCVDPRPRSDFGVNVTALVHEKRMCRYCFLSGWLSG